MYDLLFRAVWHTLNTLALDPKWLGAKTAATMVLHTWSQNIVFTSSCSLYCSEWWFDQSRSMAVPQKGKWQLFVPGGSDEKTLQGLFYATAPPGYPDQASETTTQLHLRQRLLQLEGSLVQKRVGGVTKKPFSGVHQVINYLGRYSPSGGDHQSSHSIDYRSTGEFCVQRLSGWSKKESDVFTRHGVPATFLSAHSAARV